MLSSQTEPVSYPSMGSQTLSLAFEAELQRKEKGSGRGWGPSARIFVAPRQLEAFISKDLYDGPLKPIRYVEGRTIVTGYDARILITIFCEEIWLKARADKKLQPQQLDKAQRAEELMRALADIGIVALVDEATGYLLFLSLCWRYARIFFLAYPDYGIVT